MNGIMSSIISVLMGLGFIFAISSNKVLKDKLVLEKESFFKYENPHCSEAEGFTGKISSSGEFISPSNIKDIYARLMNNCEDATSLRLYINGEDCISSLHDRVNETKVVYASSRNSAMVIGDNFVYNHLGVQIHCNRASQTNIIPQINTYIDECNASLVRGGLTPDLYPFYEKGNLILGSAHELKHNKCANLNYPTNIANNFDETFVEWAEGFAKLVQMYDGTLRDADDDLCLKYNGEPVAMKIDYWEGFNEIDSNMARYALSPIQALKIIRTTYEIAHRYNKDAKVLNGGLASLQANDAVQSLFDAVDNDGKHFWHYIDIFNFHLYAYNNKLVDIITATKLRLAHWLDYTKGFDQHDNLSNKPIWVTEIGDTVYIYSEDEQAIRVSHWLINLFAIGIDKCCYYQLLELPEIDKGTEKYYGLLIHPDYSAESIKTRPSFYAYVIFSDLYDNGSSKINIARDGELNIASWRMSNGTGCFALFTNTYTTQRFVAEPAKIKCRISVEGERVMAYNYRGEPIIITQDMEIDCHTLYIKGASKLYYRILE